MSPARNLRALSLLLSTPFLAAPATAAAAPPAPRQNIRVNDPAKDELGHTNAEPTVAVQGSRVLVGFADASVNPAGYAFSTDGGATFIHRRVPERPDGTNFGDPAVAFGPNNEAYYAIPVILEGTTSTIGVAASTDGGATFAAPVDAAVLAEDDVDLLEKPWIAVDRGASSKYKGNLYLAYTYTAQTGQQFIVTSRSQDGAASFGPPILLSAIDFYGARNPTIAVAANGDVYVAFEDGHVAPSGGITVWKSTDGGTTFRGPKGVAAANRLSYITGAGGVRATSRPSMAVDDANRVHIVYAATAAGATTDRADVFYALSTDGGGSFAAARRLNDDDGATQAQPSIAVSPDGTVGVTFLDRGDDAANDVMNGVSMRISRDGGATFGKIFRLTDTTWAHGAAEIRGGQSFHGEVQGLAFDSGTFYATWTDERGTDPDVFFATIPASFDSGTADFSVVARTPWLPVAAGATASLDVATIARNGFASPVSLSISPTVPGVDATFSPASPALGQTSRLTLSIGASVSPGNYLVTVTGAAGGLLRAAAFRLSVVSPSRGVDLPANLTATRGFTSGGAKVDPSGRIHVAYGDDSAAVLTDDVTYRRSTDGGATFSAPTKLDTTSGMTASDPALAVDGSGRVVVAFTGRLASESNQRVFVSRSTDAGATFTGPVAATPSDHYAYAPAVALDKTGNVLVAYYEVSTSTLLTTRSTNGGASWDTPQSISDPDVASITRPGLAYDSKGAAYLVYTRQGFASSGFVSAARLAIARAGRTFAASTDLTDLNTVSSFSPDVAVAPDDTVAVAYYTRVDNSNGTTNRDVKVARSTDAGATFAAAVSLAAGPQQSYLPSLAFDASGALGVAWEEDDGLTADDIFFARSTDGGKTFTAAVNVSQDPGYSGSLANPFEGRGGSGKAIVSAVGNGVFAVSWLDDSAGSSDVFFAAVRPAAFENHPPVAAITAPAAGFTAEAGVAVSFTGTGSDPDGDAVTLSWSFGDGGTAMGPTPAPHVFAAPGTYTVTLTATDARGASSTATRSITITAPTVSGTSLLVPVVLDTPGAAGSHYVTELTLASRASASVPVLLSYTASQGGGSGFARLTLAAGEERTIGGVIAYLRSQGLPIGSDASAKIGTLLVTFGGVSDPSLVFAGARTYTADPNGGAGTFGLFTPAARTTTTSVTIFGLQENDSQRSNVALVNAGADPVTLRVALRGPNGEDLGALPDQTLAGYGFFQFNRPLAGKASAGRAVVTRVSGTSPFTAYGVLNDAVTSDGSYLEPLFDTGGAGGDRLLPVVLDVAGLTSRFRTELTLANLTSAPLTLGLVYTAASGFGSGSGTVSLTLAPSEQRVLPDAIAFLRGSLPIESDGRSVAGSLLVRGPTGTPAGAFAAGARTFAPLSPAGSYGLFYAGLTLEESAGNAAFVYALREDASQRSNLALVNHGEAGPITLRVTFFSSTGATLGTVDETLAPLEWTQLGRPLAAFGATAGYAKVERISGASRFVAYGVLNDNVSADGSYVPMSR